MKCCANSPLSAAPLLLLCWLFCVVFAPSAAQSAGVCAKLSDVISSWTASTVDATVTAKWYPPGPICDAACTQWLNSCVYGCLLCSSGTDGGVGLVQASCSIPNGTSVALTPGSVVTVVGKARMRTNALSGAEYKSCSYVTLVSLAPPAPAPPPPPTSSPWDGTVRLLGPAVSVSWRLFPANSSVTFLVQALTDAFPIVGLSLGTGMTRNSFMPDATSVPAYMGWLDATGKGNVVSYMMNAKSAAGVVPTGEKLYGVKVMRTNGRLSFQFNRLLQGSGNPATFTLDATTPVPLQYTLYSTWASADNVSTPLETDMHVVKPRGYVSITLTPRAQPPPSRVPPSPAPAPAPAPAAAAVPAAVPRNVKAHAICMALAWGLFFPASALVARHCKPLGPKTFMHLHVGLNAAGGLLMIIGFACIRSFVTGDDNKHYTNIHARLGLFIFIVWWLQPLNGVLRPHKPDPGQPPSQIRSAWEMGHKVFGRGLTALAQVVAGMGITKLADVGAKHASVAAGQALWILWCIVALAGGAWYLERNAAKWMPHAEATDDVGLLDETDLQHMDASHEVQAPVAVTTGPVAGGQKRSGQDEAPAAPQSLL